MSSGYAFFTGSGGPLEEVYPQIDTISVSVYAYMDSPKKDAPWSTYDKRTLRNPIPCSGGCSDGGIDLSNVLSSMVLKRETEREGGGLCSGGEKFRGGGFKRCYMYFKYKIQITYKAENANRFETGGARIL
jgi:hypothetical protein